MRLLFQDNNIYAYNSYPQKDRLRSLGFRYDGNEKAWKSKPKDSVLFGILEEFAPSEYYTCPEVKNLLSNTYSKVLYRDNQIKKLKELKSKLFKEDFKLEGFNIPKGITLYKHQEIALKFFEESNLGNLYGDCGVGKTAIMLLLIEKLIRNREVEKVLVVCPKSIMRGAWESDKDVFCPDLKMCILDRGTRYNKAILQQNFSKHPKLEKKYGGNFDIYVINYESLKPIKDILSFSGFDMLVLDEASKLKNYKSAVSKTCVEISKSFNRKYVVSGTPAPNSEIEYFSQIKVLDPLVFGENFFKFRDTWFLSTGFMGYNKILDPMREESFIDRVYTYGLRFRQEDCVDLPERNYIELPCVMDEKLSGVYELLEKEKVLKLKDSIRTESNPLAGLLRLRQLTSSFSVDAEGDLVEFNNHKLAAVKDFVENNPNEQIVFWCCFVKDIEQLKELLGDEAGCLYGKTTQVQLDQRTKDFKQKKLKYLICNAQSVAHGHTWVNARINIFYSLTYSNELYEQACKRTHRVGQKHKVMYYHLISKTATGKDTIDSVVYYAVRNKLTKSYEIMDKFKEIALA